MSKENKATSHTPLIDHHYKTYHHRQQQVQKHKTGLLKSLQGAALAKAHGDMTWVPSKEELQSRNSTKNITFQTSLLKTKNITADYNHLFVGSNLRKRVMEATEREKKGGTKGKIVMKIMLSINKHITENSVIIEQHAT
ncbi:hypothetical protein ACJX0J_019486 [Zea mays]